MRANQVLQAKMDSSSVLPFFINTYPVHLSLEPQSLQLKFNQNSIFLSLGLMFFFHILSLAGHQMNENHPSRGHDMAILCEQFTKGICTFTRRLLSADLAKCDKRILSLTIRIKNRLRFAPKRDMGSLCLPKLSLVGRGCKLDETRQASLDFQLRILGLLPSFRSIQRTLTLKSVNCIKATSYTIATSLTLFCKLNQSTYLASEEVILILEFCHQLIILLSEQIKRAMFA